MNLSFSTSNGEHATGLIDAQVKALVHWHGPVLANRDPEPLHQMRVSMRRLRVTLQQFAPLLVLPADLDLGRLAKTSRRLGLARDLDVLRERLHDQLLPQLPPAELALLKPLLKQLKRERQQAQSQITEQLKGGSYLSWLAQMQRWLRKPAMMPLALDPLADGLLQWQLGWLSELFVHPAWSLQRLVKDCQRQQIHDLRKQIKLARYQLDNCHPWLGPRSREGLRSLKQMQELLGELNDLQVLQQAIGDQLQGSLAEDLPVLHALLQQHEAQCWQRWRLQAQQQPPLKAAQQWIEALNRDRRQAQRRLRLASMCSGLQRAVFCDWRTPLVAR